jgi:membrane protease YdiL (CAAX protease family)
MESSLIDHEDPLEQSPEIASPWVILITLGLTVLVGSALGSLFSMGLAQAQHLDLRGVLEYTQEDSPFGNRNFLRWSNLLAHLSAFTGGALSVGLIYYRKAVFAYFKVQKSPTLIGMAIGVSLMVSIFPLAQGIYWLNQQLPLPARFLQMEESATRMIKALLVMDSPWELLVNLLVVGVVPAIGEELVFRGVVQQQLERSFGRPILAIWITAALFSAIHFQFAGFLPRMVLGAGLGYLFFWSKNLWTPIIAHFFFNAVQVVAYYYLGEKAGQLQPDAPITMPNWASVAFGLAVVLMIGINAPRWFKNRVQ